MSDVFAPCGHEPPQGNSQLHGVCVFCYRDRLGKAQAKVARLRADAADVRRKALEEALSIVQREKDSGRRPDKLARVIHELRALAARQEVGE